MMISDLPARFRAIEVLQRQRDRHHPGTRRFDELDHAIDLALEPRRKSIAILFGTWFATPSASSAAAAVVSA